MRTSHSSRPARRQRGVVLLYTLIALVVLLISAVAMVRSFNTSLFNAGNLAFKRDLFNQGERARARVWPVLNGGVLGNETARGTANAVQHYSPVMLRSNAQGIPIALLGDDYTDPILGKVATGAQDIDLMATQGVMVRYVLDRQCQNTGAADAKTCVIDMGPGPCNSNTCARELEASPSRIVYRLSVRVDGPRDTQAYMQATFAF